MELDRKENTIVKDKSDERHVKISQDRTTHGPDAFDILLWGVANPDDSQMGQQEVLPPIGSN